MTEDKKMKLRELGLSIAHTDLCDKILYGISADNIEDKELATLWSNARHAIEAVDSYLEENLGEDYGWLDFYD